MEKTSFDFYASNRMKGKYKIFVIIPSLSIARDTEMKEEIGLHGWEFYFEWLWFQLTLHITFEDTAKEQAYWNKNNEYMLE